MRGGLCSGRTKAIHGTGASLAAVPASIRSATTVVGRCAWVGGIRRTTGLEDGVAGRQELAPHCDERVHLVLAGSGTTVEVVAIGTGMAHRPDREQPDDAPDMPVARLREARVRAL